MLPNHPPPSRRTRHRSCLRHHRAECHTFPQGQYPGAGGGTHINTSVKRCAQQSTHAKHQFVWGRRALINPPDVLSGRQPRVARNRSTAQEGSGRARPRARSRTRRCLDTHSGWLERTCFGPRRFQRAQNVAKTIWTYFHNKLGLPTIITKSVPTFHDKAEACFRGKPQPIGHL